MSDLDDRIALHLLEQELLGLRPQPGLAFLRAVEDGLAAPPATPTSRRARVAVAVVATLTLAAAVAATGGLSSAATSVAGAARVVKHAAQPHRVAIVRGRTAGGDHYEPGFGFGDPDHNHDGPPGIAREQASAAAPPSAVPAPDTLGKVVGAAVSFDEQVHLWISVIDPGGKPLLLTQSSKRGGSSVGNPLAGPQTKFIQYAVLVPRAIPIRLRVPANLLAPKVRYRIRIVAIDPQGNRSQLLIPFAG
jgi:hypothetical protein